MIFRWNSLWSKLALKRCRTGQYIWVKTQKKLMKVRQFKIFLQLFLEAPWCAPYIDFENSETKSSAFAHSSISSLSLLHAVVMTDLCSLPLHLSILKLKYYTKSRLLLLDNMYRHPRPRIDNLHKDSYCVTLDTFISNNLWCP